jgi:hypothetical protein
MRRILAAIALGALVTPLTSAPARAAVDFDISIVYAESAHTSGASMTLDVTCPGNRAVIGGGGGVSNGGNRVHVSVLAANGVQDRFRVGAAEIRPGNYTNSWQVYGYAICANNSALLGLSYISAESLENSNASRHQRVTCPAGQRVISAGAAISSGESGYIVLDDLQITSDLRSVDVWAVEREGGTNDDWSVFASAVCINTSTLTGLRLVESTSPWGPGIKTLATNCPDQRVLGLGMALSNSGGHTVLQRLVPEENSPGASMTIRPDPSGVPDDWQAKLQAVCAD